MPQFFDKKKLTQKQLENWNRYVNMYEKTLGFNVNRELLEMHEHSPNKLADMFGTTSFDKIKEKMITNAELMGNIPGDEKSALFYRLISGKKPFLYRVPLSYSYPDYDIMESENSRELTLDILPMSQLIEKKKGTETLNINQCLWKVLSYNNNFAAVTFGEWEKLGFVWTIELEDLKAEDSQKAIIAHHNPKLLKITKYDELLKEIEFQVRLSMRGILINLDESEAEKVKQDYKKYGGLADIMYHQEELRGKELLSQRRSNNLSNYPSDEEIQELVKKDIPQYLGQDYYVVGNDLYLKAWKMKKISQMKMKDEYYIDLPVFE